MLGAAGGQIAFNLGSAIGAFSGGIMIAPGFGWNSVALPAAALSFLAMSALLIYGCHQRQMCIRDRAYDVIKYFNMMDNGNVTGYICQGFNPVASFPDKNKVVRSLSKLKYMVVIDPLVTRCV